MKARIRAFWLLTLLVFIAPTLPILVQQGMFVDGVIYATISRNLAEGLGSFWAPRMDNIHFAGFFEHPPLVFWIQSFFFKILGTSQFTERFFTFSLGILSLLMTAILWMRSFDGVHKRSMVWLPLILWSSIPLVSWSIRNNLLESSMTIFLLFTILFQLKAIKNQSLVHIAIASIFMVLAFLSKGFVALFPLSTFILYKLIHPELNWSRSIKYTLLFTLVAMLSLAALFYLIPESLANLKQYVHQQLLPSLNNERSTTNNRFAILTKLLLELGLPLALSIVLLIRKKGRSIDQSQIRMALFFILIGIAASLPLLISLKQRPFYLLPSLPFYILGISIFLHEWIYRRINKLSDSHIFWIRNFAILGITAVLIISAFKFGQFNRDEEMLKDVYLLADFCPKESIIQCADPMTRNYGLKAYLYRFGYLSLDDENNWAYYLEEKSIMPPNSDSDWELVDLGLNKYDLWKRINHTQ